jgi:hypothetical protein
VDRVDRVSRKRHGMADLEALVDQVVLAPGSHQAGVLGGPRQGGKGGKPPGCKKDCRH